MPYTETMTQLNQVKVQKAVKFQTTLKETIGVHVLQFDLANAPKTQETLELTLKVLKNVPNFALKSPPVNTFYGVNMVNVAKISLHLEIVNLLTAISISMNLPVSIDLVK